MRRASIPRREQGASTVLIIVLVLLITIVVAGGTIGGLYFAGVLGGGNTAMAKMDSEMAVPKPIYLPLEPPLVANFDRKGRVGYLQAGIEIMAHSPATIEAVQQHMPVIRNELLLLMSGKSYDALRDRAGKEKLRSEAIAEINDVLAERRVDGSIEAVYFTSFVMQ